jgi:hypothetical protein
MKEIDAVKRMQLLEQSERLERLGQSGLHSYLGHGGPPR